MSLTPLCRDFMAQRCPRGAACRYRHDEDLCPYFWRNGRCRDGDACPKRHDETRTPPGLPSAQAQRPKKKVKNTETFEPLGRPVDMRVVVDVGTERWTTPIQSRDVVLVPNLFRDFAPGEIYRRLVAEIERCGIPEERLLKLWHGDSHWIADDHTDWKRRCPTFQMVLDRIRSFFEMDVQATRFNWYKDTRDWKPFHFDAAAVKPEKAAIQNFTVAASFGATRDAAFEDARTKTVVSMPQPDGTLYCFAEDTNRLWRHGILQEAAPREEGRISVIAWGKIHHQASVPV